MRSEKQLIDLVLADEPMMFRNAVGYGIACDPRKVQRVAGGKMIITGGCPVRFGLHPGSADMIGWKTLEITQDMVGKKVAVFQSIEIKTERDRLRDDQRTWNRVVSEHGGIAQVWKDTPSGLLILMGKEIQ